MSTVAHKIMPNEVINASVFNPVLPKPVTNHLGNDSTAFNSPNDTQKLFHAENAW